MKNMKTRVNNLTSSAMALCIAFISFGCQKSNDPGTSAENLAATKPKTVTEATCTVQGWASQNGGTTGGGTAAPTVVTNYADLKAAILNVNVKVVQVNGTITIPLGGRISFQDQTGKTIFGSAGAKLVSNDQTKANSGIINVKRCTNIMIRNLIFEGPGAYDVDGWDNAIIDASTNIWVDHCEFRDGVDGNFDIKNVSDYITVSNCKFAYLKPPRAGGSGGSDDHRFSGLIGSSDSATADRNRLRVTFVRCWWAEGCVARMPRVRFGKIHLVNNYFNSTVSKSCIQAGFEANILAEANVFENVKNPVDLMDNKSTAVQLKDNIFTTVTGNISGNGNTAFTPPYNISPLNSSSVKATVTSSGGAGATLTGNNCS